MPLHKALGVRTLLTPGLEPWQATTTYTLGLPIIPSAAA